LATYLLGRKRIEEHRAILPHLEELGKWKQVRLAIADKLEDVGLSREQLQETISTLLGREYAIGGGDAGREALRVELLRDVLADAKEEDVGDQDKYQVYNDAAQALYDLYTAQAILLRASEWPEEPVTPTVVSQAVIETHLKELLEAKLAPDGKEQAQRIQVDLRAIDYLATNDLQKLVLLDRAWLRLLAVDLARQRPGQKTEADVLVERLALRDRDAKHVLIQLRDGHETILRMWLLLNQTD
jgi:DNA-binding transcriptional ArsR family regulator